MTYPGDREESSWRTLEDEVRDLLTAAESAAITDLDPYIYAAHLVIDECVHTGDYSADLLEELERWLSAHIAVATVCIDPRVSSQTMGDVTVTYSTGRVTDDFLLTTRYGRTVKLLDAKGRLTSNRKEASIQAW